MFNKNNIGWEEHDRLRECVKPFMSERRYAHTLGVEQESEKLARIFGCGNEEISKLKAAALLHDITKETERDIQLELCEKYKIELSGDDMRVDKEWHAKTGAYVARHEFGACDIIFNAIYYHTFGASYKDFDLPGKIIYLADYIEPGRNYQACLDVRGYFYKNLECALTLEDKYKLLDDTVLLSFDKIIGALLTERLFIHGNTVRNRNSFLSRE